MAQWRQALTSYPSAGMAMGAPAEQLSGEKAWYGVHSNAFDGLPGMLIGEYKEYKVQIVGRRSSPHVQEYREFLERNGVPFRWVDLERDPLVHLLLGSGEPVAGTQLPFFLLEDGSRLDVVSSSDEQRGYTQTLALLAERMGLHVWPSRELYDLVIVGAGPAGLTAAVGDDRRPFWEATR